MKRQSLEEYRRQRREQAAQAIPTTPGDDERKERVLERGRECLRRVKGDTTWEDWMGIGAALMVITEEAMETVGATVWDANNRRLVKEFSDRWDGYETSALDKGSNQKPLSKQERWALREVMTNPEIGGWRSTLDGVNRRKLNHPNKVIERWRRATQVRDTEPKPPSPSLSQALKDKNRVIEELEARNAELREEREGARALTVEEAIDALVTALEGASSERRSEVLTEVSTRLGFTVQRKKVRTKKKLNPLAQAEDAMNVALGGLMGGAPSRPPKKKKRKPSK